MKNNSRQAKGRYLQNIVRDRIVKLYPSLTKKDIRTSNTGENGADVRLLTHTAKKLFPYSVETKNMKSYRLLYEAFKQAQRHTNMEPLLVLKGHREKPVVIIDMEHFFNILEVD
jgi:hypothetical protein|tara:strand:- start:230 stop:571 length:342 start_codon:yes stop_codon:yes gene_type:complete